MLSSESNSASASARDELGLARRRSGPRKMNEPIGRRGSLMPGARADDGVGDELHRLVLADHALVQDLVEAQQLLALALHQPGDRDAGPARDDLGDLVLGDLLAQQPLLALLLRRAAPPRPAAARSSSGQLAVAQLGGAVEVVAALGLLDLAPHLLDLLAQRLQPADRLALGLPLGASSRRPARAGRRAPCAAPRGAPGWPRRSPCSSAASSISSCITRRVICVELLRHRVDLGADHGARLVDEVDRLVGQEAVGDVAVRQRRRGDQRGVLDPHAVVDLEALAQAAQDRDRVLDASARRRCTGWKRRSSAASFSMCLRYSSSVVAPMQCSSPRASIGLSMLPASIAPSAAPAPTTVCSSSMNSRIRPSAALTSWSTAFRRSSNSPRYLAPATQRAHVEREDGLVAQALGHVAAHDPLGEPLDDRRLADAGVADQHRVVLGLAREDLDHAADLRVAADHRVELAAARLGDEVAAVLLERLVGGLRASRW